MAAQQTSRRLGFAARHRFDDFPMLFCDRDHIARRA